MASNVKDTLSRLNGVGDVQTFGAQYACVSGWTPITAKQI